MQTWKNKDYFKKLKLIEDELDRIQAHNNNLIKINLFLCEAVIEPEKIKINTLNSDELTKQFKKFNIVFIYIKRT